MFYYTIHNHYIINHFNPLKYSGLWYEVSSKKTNQNGIAAKCRNTKTIIDFDADTNKIHSQTACGDYQGNMKVFLESEIICKDNNTRCKISYPADPFIPTLNYNIIDTDYTTYSFVAINGNGNKNSNKESQNWQIYSRVPYPGTEWIEQMKERLLSISSLTTDEINEFYDTPLDLACVPLISS